MFFSLDVLRARKGDCLMLHWGSSKNPKLMLIDGGPSGVYAPQLKPRLQQIIKTRKIAEDEALPVDVVMVSHIDDDHIKGLIELTKEQLSKTPPFELDVATLWHNSFDDLLKTTPEELKPEAAVATASVLAGLDDDSARETFSIEGEDKHQAEMVLANVPQSRTLRDDAAKLKWKPNRQFKGKLIFAVAGGKAIDLGDDLSATVAGPLKLELEALQKAHDKWLKQQKAKKPKASSEAALAAYIDKSVPNLSSIVVLLETGKGKAAKSILLTGDARGDKILEGLELIKKIPKPGGKLHVNILKCPHHGSDNNVEPKFFKRLTADHYIFSGDGEHGNPERATLQMLLDARGTDDKYVVHLTYPVEEIDAQRKIDWAKKKSNAKWSPKTQGLVAFFADNPKFAKKLSFVEENASHLIDLLDEVEIKAG